MGIIHIFKGVTNEWEIGRTLLASSGFAAIFTPIGFEAWHMAKGGMFDVAAWCAAYPGGLAVLSGVGVFSIGKKDKDVATARLTVAQPPLSDDGTK